ncbi:MAG: DUF1329 domain-containing protein [Candidatus Dadabacteria bacterium]|nr:MAG: DUF1329 domain-containing protein [Candidatus Dadabacteria bacterium]
MAEAKQGAREAAVSYEKSITKRSRLLVAKVATVPMALIVVLGLPRMSMAQPGPAPQLAPGTVIDRTNAELARDLVSPGVLWAVRNGMDLRIVPYRRIPLPAAYEKATEKYAAQCHIGPRGELLDWVAGRPFPVIDPNDPEAARKIMYNFERTHYFSDDLNMHLVDADTGSLYIDSKGRRHYQVERHFVADWLRVLQYVGRLYHEPLPAFAKNPDRTFRKSGLYPLIEPFDLKGVGGISYRYLDMVRQDDTWLYLPSLRRVRRMSSAQRSDALFGQDIDVDSYGGYAGQIPWFEWKLLGEKPMLASLHGDRLPPEPCEKDGGMTFCEVWELRPSVYVIEGRPKAPGYAYSKRVIYVDKETYFVVYSDLYDQGGELWKVVMQSIRTSKRPNPSVDYEYEEERMFIYAFTVIDMQLMHGTRAAIPGMAFPDEAGWYIDIGFDAPQSAGEEWFTVAGLIRGAR